MPIAALAVLLALQAPAAAGARPGELDLSFGQGGYAAVQTVQPCLSGCLGHGGLFTSSSADALALQPTGGIVLGGYNSARRGVDPDVRQPIGAPSHDGEEAPGAIVRLNPNGTADTSFGGSGGIVRTPFEVTDIHANARGGLRVTGVIGQRTGVQRYTSSGVLDGFYGTQGVRWSPLLAEGQRDGRGRILEFTTGIVPATDYHEAVEKSAITRILPSGQRDTRFGHHGYVSLPTEAKPVGLASQRDESVLFAFTTGNRIDPLKPSYIFIEHLTPTGRLDRSFGTRGIARIPLRGFTVGITLFPAPDGDLLIAGGEHRGTSLLEGEDYLMLAAYTRAGRPDRHFGHDGITRSRLPINSPDAGQARAVDGDETAASARPYRGPRPTAIAFDASGNVVMSGDAHGGFLARYTPHGRDCAFGSGGVIVDERFGGMSALALQPNGRIVVAGGGGEFRAARYMGGASHTCAGEPTAGAPAGPRRPPRAGPAPGPPLRPPARERRA